MTRQDLIDLAIEYCVISSTSQFNAMNAKQQEAILAVVRKLVKG